MAESFGGRLRQQREQRQIALTTIAEQTKISLSLLEALERDDVSHWPAGIFRRAFIRAYAHAIGLEPDVVVREFLEHYPDPIEVVEPLSAIAAAAGMSGGPPTRLRYVVGSAIDSLSRFGHRVVQRRGSAVDDDVPAAETPTFNRPNRTNGRERAVSAGSDLAGRPVKASSSPSTLTGDQIAERAARTPSNGADAAPSESRTPPQCAHHAPWRPRAKGAATDCGSPTDSVHAGMQRADSVSSVHPDPAASEPDLLAVAQLCTAFGRIAELPQASPLLREAAGILEAVGLIVWVWDSEGSELRPALAHGYSDRVLAQLPRVGRDADNATAAAFRIAQSCVVNGSNLASGALVVPLLTPTGCVGVLAIELQHGREQRDSVRALASIFAAQLARLAAAARTAGAADRRLA